MKWIALMVSATFRHGDRDAMVGEVRSIFGNDLAEMRLVDDEAMRSSGEYYCFVNISNYETHVDALMNSGAVCRVVPAYDRPHEFSELEVEAFGNSADKAQIRGEFETGDMVLVKEGRLKGLYGIVFEILGEDRYSVAFKMYTRKFEEVVEAHSMEFVDNVFKHLKFPVTMENVRSGDVYEGGDGGMMEALSKIVKCNKIRRKKGRGNKV